MRLRTLIKLLMLALLVVVTSAWIRSYFRSDFVSYTTEIDRGDHRQYLGLDASCTRGSIVLAYQRFDIRDVGFEYRKNYPTWTRWDAGSTKPRKKFQSTTIARKLGFGFESLGRDREPEFHVWIPHWALIVLLFAFFQWLSPKRVSPGSCATCGYDLRASAGRCPECGSPVNKLDPPKSSPLARTPHAP
jgi:hypothetical protein